MLAHDRRSPVQHIFFIVLLSSAMAAWANPEGQGSNMATWFPSSDCGTLTISRFKSGQGDGPVQSMRIADRNAIARLMKRIESIAPDGDMMKSLLVDERLHLEFDCGNGTMVIDIYDGRFKTASTGFNSNRKDKEIEAQVYRDLKGLLHPAVGESVLLVQGLSLDFPEFTVTFQGTTVRPQQPDEPTIGPISTDLFLVKPKAGPELSLNVISAQLPPQPLSFEVDSRKYVLYTFMDEKGKRLDPYQFKIGLAR